MNDIVLDPSTVFINNRIEELAEQTESLIARFLKDNPDLTINDVVLIHRMDIMNGDSYWIEKKDNRDV